jgi:hypothetical protein
LKSKISLSTMTEEAPKLQKYFEDDPPSLFDELDVNNTQQNGNFHKKLEMEFTLKKKINSITDLNISNEVRDLWPFPKHPEMYPPTVPCVSIENLVGRTNEFS